MEEHKYISHIFIFTSYLYFLEHNYYLVVQKVYRAEVFQLQGKAGAFLKPFPCVIVFGMTDHQEFNLPAEVVADR